MKVFFIDIEVGELNVSDLNPRSGFAAGFLASDNDLIDEFFLRVFKVFELFNVLSSVLFTLNK